METDIRNRKHTKNNTAIRATKKNVKQLTSKDNVLIENVPHLSIKNNVWSERGSGTDDCDPGVFQKRDEVKQNFHFTYNVNFDICIYLYVCTFIYVPVHLVHYFMIGFIINDFNSLLTSNIYSRIFCNK